MKNRLCNAEKDGTITAEQEVIQLLLWLVKQWENAMTHNKQKDIYLSAVVNHQK